VWLFSLCCAAMKSATLLFQASCLLRSAAVASRCWSSPQKEECCNLRRNASTVASLGRAAPAGPCSDVLCMLLLVACGKFMAIGRMRRCCRALSCLLRPAVCFDRAEGSGGGVRVPVRCEDKSNFPLNPARASAEALWQYSLPRLTHSLCSRCGRLARGFLPSSFPLLPDIPSVYFAITSFRSQPVFPLEQWPCVGGMRSS